MVKVVRVNALDVAVFPTAAAHVDPAAQHEHTSIYKFGCPAYRNVKPEPPYDDRAVDHVYDQCYKFELECHLGTSGA